MPISIVFPTVGRPTLARTLFSVIEQLEPGDAGIFVADPKGDTEYVRWCYELASNKVGVDWQFDIHDEPGSGWGQAQRNRGYELADPMSHVWCLADDNIAMPDALASIRRRVAPSQWAIFRVGRGSASAWVWQTQNIVVGNIDADCIVAPAFAADRYGVKWGLGYTGDLDFAHAMSAEMGPPFWADEVIAVTKPTPHPDGGVPELDPVRDRALGYLNEHYESLARRA